MGSLLDYYLSQADVIRANARIRGYFTDKEQQELQVLDRQARTAGSTGGIGILPTMGMTQEQKITRQEESQEKSGKLGIKLFEEKLGVGQKFEQESAKFQQELNQQWAKFVTGQAREQQVWLQTAFPKEVLAKIDPDLLPDFWAGLKATLSMPDKEKAKMEASIAWQKALIESTKVSTAIKSKEWEMGNKPIEQIMDLDAFSLALPPEMRPFVKKLKGQPAKQVIDLLGSVIGLQGKVLETKAAGIGVKTAEIELKKALKSVFPTPKAMINMFQQTWSLAKEMSKGDIPSEAEFLTAGQAYLLGQGMTDAASSEPVRKILTGMYRRHRGDIQKMLKEIQGFTSMEFPMAGAAPGASPEDRWFDTLMILYNQ